MAEGKHPEGANSIGFDLIADMVRMNFDLVLGSRKRAVADTKIPFNVLSHVLTGRTRSWRHLKTLTRWFRQEHPGFGWWLPVYEFFGRKFPEEAAEWNEYAAEWRQQTAPMIPRAPKQMHSTGNGGQ